jgi:plastocyanin
MPVKSARPDCGPNAECYVPSYYVVKTGEIVYWENQDSAFHSVTSGQQENHDGLFDSGHIDPYEKFSYEFNEAGVYSYHCTLHPWMNGMIKVER